MITTFGGFGQLANLVSPNPKCNGCLHYLSNQSACEIGLNPSICGDGSHPIQGYAPLDSTGPDSAFTELPGNGLVEPMRAGGPVGTGQPNVPMATSHLGDASELLALSERMVPDLKKSAMEGCSVHSFNDGGFSSNMYAAMHNADSRCQCLPFTLDDAAKAVHSELSNRLRRRLSVDTVKAFIVKNDLF